MLSYEPEQSQSTATKDDEIDSGESSFGEEMAVEEEAEDIDGLRQTLEALVEEEESLLNLHMTMIQVWLLFHELFISVFSCKSTYQLIVLPSFELT